MLQQKMTSRYELMLSDYTPQLNQQKQRLIKQRKNIFIGIGIASLILLSFLIANIVLFVQYHKQYQELNTIQSEIQDFNRLINDSYYNKKILLNDTHISSFELSSHSQSAKTIKVINLTNHYMNSLQQMYLHHLEQLYINTNQWKLQDNQLMFRLSKCYLPNLEKAEFTDLMFLDGNCIGLEELPSFKQIADFGGNYFPNLKKIVFENIRVDNFHQNHFDAVEEIRLINTSCFNFQTSHTTNLKNLTLNDSTNVLQVVHINNSPLLQKIQIISNNYISLYLNGSTNLKQVICKIPRVRSISITDSCYIDFDEYYKQLTFLWIQDDETIQTLDLSQFPKLTSLRVFQSSLKHIVISGDSSFNLSIIDIKGTQIESFSNLRLSLASMNLKGNHKLKQFSNISSFSLLNLLLGSEIQRINDNRLDLLMYFGDNHTTTTTQYPNLVLFYNNSLPNLQHLSLTNTKLSSMKYNFFSTLLSLNLTNSKFNDSSVANLLQQNSFKQPEIMQFVDLSNNMIVNKEKVKKLLQEFFINAKIIL